MKQVVNDRQSLTYLAEGCGEFRLVQAGADILKETNQRYRDRDERITRIFRNVESFYIFRMKTMKIGNTNI